MKVKITDTDGKVVEVLGESWADRAASLSADAELLYDKQRLLGDVPDTPRQMTVRECAATISSLHELTKLWEKEHVTWLQQKAAWEAEPEHLPAGPDSDHCCQDFLHRDGQLHAILARSAVRSSAIRIWWRPPRAAVKPLPMLLQRSANGAGGPTVINITVPGAKEFFERETVRVVVENPRAVQNAPCDGCGREMRPSIS